MPEITVEDEPWVGLVVLADTKHVYSSPGYYGLARADEWHSDAKEVTFWRGPEKKEELISKARVVEMDCRTVLVDDEGFYKKDARGLSPSGDK